jgi:hypothetical protein
MFHPEVRIEPEDGLAEDGRSCLMELGRMEYVPWKAKRWQRMPWRPPSVMCDANYIYIYFLSFSPYVRIVCEEGEKEKQGED